MIMAFLYWLVKREYNLSRDKDFGYRMMIALELLLEIAVVISLIVISMGLN